LPDPKRETRFHALPANDHTFVFLSHGHLPGNWLLLRLPEYAWREKGGRVHEARRVRWIWEDGGWTYTWAVPDAMKRRALLDFKGRIVPGVDRVLYEITATNPGEERWYSEQMSYACMRCADAPLFHDFEATRTFVRQGDEFVTALAATGGKLHVNKRGDSRVGGGPGPLLARRSVDEKYALGIFTDRAQGAGGNFVPHAFCMHSNPAWGRLAPGESKTNFGCVFIVDGGIERLWVRCVADFDLE